MKNITERSTKAVIIKAAEELISKQQSQLDSQSTSLANLREERSILVLLLTLFFTLWILF